MYFDKLMRMATSRCLEISTNTMHQHVSHPITPRMTVHMLPHELDRGTISVYADAMGSRVHFNKMSPLSALTDKVGISSPPSTITRMSKIWSHHNGLSVSDVLHGLLKPFYLTWAHMHCDVTSSQLEVQVWIVECKSHRVVEESWV